MVRTHRSVLKTTNTMTTKNERARRACCDRRKDRYITSMVLGGRLAVSSPYEMNEDMQKYSVIIAEWSEYT